MASTALTLNQIDSAFEGIAHADAAIMHWPTQDVQTGISRNRGDGWQIRMDIPRMALRAALLVRAEIRSRGNDLSTRIAIAIGHAEADTPNDPNESIGAVFVASGRLLDGMPRGTTMAHASGGALSATTRLADHISQNWTKAQAAAMVHALTPNPPTRAEIGRALGKSRQAVDQALTAAGYPALSDALRMIETTHE